jgi:hypothetical protein
VVFRGRENLTKLNIAERVERRKAEAMRRAVELMSA